MLLVWELCLFFYAFLFDSVNTVRSNYDPTWDSLDQRPLPKWFDDAKFGIFLHWGVYSVPSFGSEWFWPNWKGGKEAKYTQFMRDNYPPGYTYQDFASSFTAEFYNPEEWAKLFKKAGAKYVVLTSKHHDGYCLWPSKHSYSWNAKDVGPTRDLLGDLAKAVRKESLVFGTYYSLYEWYNPLYISDKATNFSQNTFMVNKVIPEMMELIQKYEPHVLWADGDWEANDTYFKSTEFLAWLFNESPVKDSIVVNDRWGHGIPCHHGDFYTCKDRYNPGVLQRHKWENAMTVDAKSWGFRRDANLEDIYTPLDLITILAQTVSCGGNLLMNVGPTRDGRIDFIFQERLLQIGQWLSINGEAIYETRPWLFQNDSVSGNNTWYTCKGSDLPVYAITLQWPAKNVLELGSARNLFMDGTVVSILGGKEQLKWSVSEKTVKIQFPDKATVASEWAWVLKIEPKKHFQK